MTRNTRAMFYLCGSLIFSSCAHFMKVANKPQPAKQAPNNVVRQGFSLSNEFGTIWFPFSLTVRSDSGESPANETFLMRNLSLLITNTKNLQEHAVPLQTLGSTPTRNLNLSPSEPERTFFIPRVFSLPEGTYNLLAVVGERSVSGERASRISIPLPAWPGHEITQTFSVKTGAITALPRIGTFVTVSGNSTSPSFRVQLELKDSSFIPEDIALANLDLDHTFANRFVVSDDYPIKQRLSLSTNANSIKSFEPVAAQVGILFDIPCDLDGHYRLVWKRSGDPREYVSSLEFSKSNSKECSNNKTVPLILNLPPGTWNLVATHFGSSPVTFDYKFPPLWETNPTVREYFSLQSPLNALAWSGTESDIKRKISFRVPELIKHSRNTPSIPFLYAGRLAITTQSRTEAKGVSIATVWDRRFSLQDLQGKFAKHSIINAYSFNAITRDQTKSEVQSLLKVGSNDPRKTDRLVVEFRKESTSMFAACVIEREQIDPLIAVIGVINFTAIPGTNYVDLVSSEVTSDDRSRASIVECLERKILGFRFSETVTARFSGEAKFTLE